MGSIGRFALRAWLDLGEDGQALGLVETPASPVPLSSNLPVSELALDSVSIASLAATLASHHRTRGPLGSVAVSPTKVATAFQSDRHVRIDNVPPTIWAALSGFWPTQDGWVRTHANYPHHAHALAALLGVETTTDPEIIARSLRARSGYELEAAAATSGAVLAAVRTTQLWRDTPHARAVRSEPLITTRQLDGDAPSRGWASFDGRPLSGLRVLDLTRVIAGPVCTRTLAYLGAEVLRLDSPGMPEPAWQHYDTGAGKRSAQLDFATPDGWRALHELLSQADVVVCGYRPGALDEYGLSPDALAAEYPGLVIGQVSAWGLHGPWSTRRGFDSIVQAATGIAWRESPDGEKPGAMPAQALDHSAGYFLATAITCAVVRQRQSGGTHHVFVSLARIADELLRTPGSSGPAPGYEPALVQGPAGGVEGSPVITCAAPAVEFPGASGDYGRLAGLVGTDHAAWSSMRTATR